MNYPRIFMLQILGVELDRDGGTGLAYLKLILGQLHSNSKRKKNRASREVQSCVVGGLLRLLYAFFVVGVQC